MATTLDTVLHPQLVTLDLRATSRDEAIEELAQLLVADGRVTDLPTYLAAVRAREDQGSTGMGLGIAIPHAKSPAVARTGLAVARSATGVDFGSDTGERSQLLFLIAAPEGSGDEHITLLSRLARRLVHAELRTALLGARSAEEAVQLLRAEVSS